MDEGGEDERHEDHAGGAHREDEHRGAGAGLGADPEVAAVTSVNTTRATALPIEAIAFRSKTDGQDDRSRRRDQQPGRGPPAEPSAPSPAGTARSPPSARDSPAAGYSPALVAPAVANRAVTLISQ